MESVVYLFVKNAIITITIISITSSPSAHAVQGVGLRPLAC